VVLIVADRDIPEEMVEKATQALRDAGFVDPDDDTVPTFFADRIGDARIDMWVPARDAVVAVLSAALAGRTVREIPEQIQGLTRLEHCRACRDERDEIVTADFILWGKLLPPEQMGPRCYDHTAGYLGYRAMSQIDQWAVFDLRPFNQLLASGSGVGDQDG
jgi:hypothetical protein